MEAFKNNQSHILLFWSLPSISMLEIYKEKCRKLNEARHSLKSVKILTSQNKTFQLSDIGIESGRFYGYNKLKGRMNKMLLNIHDIKMIFIL